jgi:hypothetical protein
MGDILNESSPQKSLSASSSGKMRKWYQKKRFIIPIVLFVSLGFIGSLQDTEGNTEVTSLEPTSSISIPNLEGLVSADAYDQLMALGFNSVDIVDASPEDRTVILRSGWKVCSTNPASGTSIQADTAVSILSVKDDENCPNASVSAPSEAPSEEPSEEPTEIAVIDLYGKQPAVQKAALEIIEKFKSKYDLATNDLQRADARLTRDEQICKATKGSAISNWTGVVETIGGTSEGEAYLTIKISEDVTLGTWNNTLSDYADETLISRKSPIYKTVLGLQEGQIVKFSGKFVPADGACLDTKNITEYFAVNSPEFVFRFTKIGPA